MQGCQNGHLHIVRLLVRLGLHRIDARGEMLNTFGTTPFYIAAQNGHLPILQYLLTVETIKARWFEHAEKNGATPFYIACEQGHLAVAEFLAKQGANFEAANSCAILKSNILPLTIFFETLSVVFVLMCRARVALQ